MVLLNNLYVMLNIWQTCLWPPYRGFTRLGSQR